MENKSKFATIVLFLLISTMLLTVLSQNIFVNAQDDEATVVVLSSVGGTTNPTPGTYNYANGTTITLIATPNTGFEFLYWVISGSYTPTHNQPPLIIPGVYVDDPTWVPDLPQPDVTGIDSVVLTQERLDIICGYGYTYTYQAVFAPTEPSSGVTDAVVIVADAVGGTTNPGAGTYTYPEGQTITLTATPATGFEFRYWIISGSYTPTHNQPPLIIPEFYVNDPDYVPDLPQPDVTGIDNLVLTQQRLDIICGYGYTFTYQAVFAPTELSSGETDAIVIVADAVGGTTNPGAGTYTYPEGQTITLTATPDAGFEFLYWVISGSYRQGHNQQPVILPEQFADDPSFVPDLPQLDVTGIDSLVSTQSRLDIICGYGYAYTYQPVFTPMSADVPQPGEQPQIPEQPEPETPEQPEPSHPLGLSNEAITLLIAILAIVVIIAIGFAAYIYMKNRK
jgi:hypothetical protein